MQKIQCILKKKIITYLHLYCEILIDGTKISQFNMLGNVQESSRSIVYRKKNVSLICVLISIDEFKHSIGLP